MQFEYYYIFEYQNRQNKMLYRCACATDDKNENGIGKNAKFKKDWKKLGSNGFVKKILKRCINEEEFKEAEKYFLSEGFLANKMTYNNAPKPKKAKVKEDGE